MRYSRKLIIVRLILVLSSLACLMAGCRERAESANSNQNVPQANHKEEVPDDISGGSTVYKERTPKAAANVVATPTPKSSKTTNVEAARTPETEQNNARTDNKNETSAPIKYILGPRGNCYFVNGYGEKIFVSKSLCGTNDNPNISPKITPLPPSETRQYILGPRGNCFFINSFGQKIFVNKAKCNQ